jgi:hypothetical protein
MTDVVKIKSRDTVGSLRILLQEVCAKREAELAEHQDDQLHYFEQAQRISDGLDDSIARNTKLWSLLVISSGLNLMAVSFIAFKALGVF